MVELLGVGRAVEEVQSAVWIYLWYYAHFYDLSLDNVVTFAGFDGAAHYGSTDGLFNWAVAAVVVGIYNFYVLVAVHHTTHAILARTAS